MRFSVFPTRCPSHLSGLAAGLVFCLTFLACGVSAAGSAPPAQAPSLDHKFLQPLTAGLPEPVRSGIMADVPGFEAVLRLVLVEDSDLLVLVDKSVALPATYEPRDLVVISSLKPAIPVKQADPPLKLRRLAVRNYQAMEQAARKSGVTLVISSAYRSYDYQVALFDRNVKESGLREAERFSARAGHSQHQLGLAIDFNSITEAFAETKAGQWVFAHAAEYGFSLSYPQGQEAETGYVWEPWHYRYIGIPACELQQRFFGGSQQLMLVFLARNADVLRAHLGIASLQASSSKGSP